MPREDEYRDHPDVRAFLDCIHESERLESGTTGREGRKPSLVTARELRTFGSRMRERRKALGIGRDELAARVGVCASTIYNIERASNRPGNRTAKRIAGVLGVSVAELTGRGKGDSRAA